MAMKVARRPTDGVFRVDQYPLFAGFGRFYIGGGFGMFMRVT